MNALLKRQINEFLGDLKNVPESLRTLFDAISDTYNHLETKHHHTPESRSASQDDLSSMQQKLDERKQLEEELRQTISLLTAALESTAAGILVLDGNGHIKGYNKEFASMWRIPNSILESQDDDQTLSFVVDQLEDLEASLAQRQELQSSPTFESSDIVSLRDGRVFECYSKPQSIDNHIVGRVWSFRDATERIQADREQTRLLEKVEKANRELEKVNQELNDFAYLVSHDLKAPLRGIKVLAGWIASDYADSLDNEGKENLKLLLSRVDRMEDLIGGILQYSRIGRHREELIEIDLNELVPGIVDMLAPPEHITVTIQENLPIIQCERTKTSQVFQNLLSNAIKYIDKPDGQIVVSCTEQSEFWEFRVSDNGPGIESKHFDKIFQMFQTLSPRDELESTGVGLAVVKKIVEMYGGDVSVESEPHKGTTFVFSLSKISKGTADAQLQTSATR